MFFMESTSQDLRYIQIICILSILHIDRQIHTERKIHVHKYTHICTHITAINVKRIHKFEQEQGKRSWKVWKEER